MQFAHPNILWLFLLMIPLIVWYILRQRDAYPAMSVSSATPFSRMPRSFRSYLRHLVFICELGAIGCMIIILARPQEHDTSTRTSNVEGTDLILALDVSSSMLADDIEPDRLTATKNTAINFINGRPNDNIGLVIFAGESLSALPMTTDHASVVNYINNIGPKMLVDGTAIGDGIATAINRLSDERNADVDKSIILITDGTNNSGIVFPKTAAEIAAEKGIKIYTIAIGSNSTANIPLYDYFGRVVGYQPVPVEIDTKILEEISAMTNGRAYRAEDKLTLQKIFAEIDQLETQVLDVKELVHTEDNYELWAFIAAGLIAFIIFIRQTLLRTVP